MIVSTSISESHRRGSTLILAVIFTALLTLVSGALLARVVHERKTMEASAESASLLYLAEGFAERAMWEIGKSGDWTGWQSRAGGDERYLEERVTLGGGRSYQVRTLAVKKQNGGGFDEWTIHSEAGTRLGSGRILNRQLMIDYTAEVVEKLAQPAGVISRDKMDFSGQAEVYAYNSEFGPPSRLLNRLDQVTVATVSGSSDAFKLSGQIDIYGFAGTGGSAIEISGGENKILGEDSDPSGGNVDQSRIFSDFTYEFPEIEQPDWKAAGVVKRLPRSKKGVITLGDPLAFEPTVYDLDKLDLGDGVVEIVGPVVLRLRNGMSIGGDGSIRIVGNGSAEVYTVSDVTISGQGIVNLTNRPKNFMIYGTVGKAKDQTVSISGDGFIAAVVYAPNAIINISGGGSLAGAVTGYEIKQSGQANIYYDVSLGKEPDNGAAGNPKVAGWYDVSTDPFPIGKSASDSGFQSSYPY